MFVELLNKHKINRKCLTLNPSAIGAPKLFRAQRPLFTCPEFDHIPQIPHSAYYIWREKKVITSSANKTWEGAQVLEKIYIWCSWPDCTRWERPHLNLCAHIWSAIIVLIFHLNSLCNSNLLWFYFLSLFFFWLKDTLISLTRRLW